MPITRKAAALAFLLSLSVAAPAAAQQTINIVVGFPAGASYDIYMRTFARHLGKHLPGTTVVPQNMAGAGSLRVANYLYNVAPKDGSTIGMFARGLAMQPLLDDRGIQFDARKFNWIGSISSEVSVVLSWHTRSFKTIADAQQREMIVSASGPGADSVIFPLIMNGVLGTKFKVVAGYPGAVDFLLAVERGEADGTAGVSWSTIASSKPDWIREKKITIMSQLATKRHADLAAAPLITDLAKTDSDRHVLELIFARQEIAYPLVAPPGVPAERVETLRRAFNAVLKDPDYLADARRQSLDSDPVDGAAITALIERIYSSPAEVIARARAAIEEGRNVTTTKK